MLKDLVERNAAVNSTTDFDYSNESSNNSQDKRTKLDVEYELRTKEIEAGNFKVQSKERSLKAEENTKRLRYILWAIVLTFAIFYNSYSDNYILKLGRKFFKELIG